MTDLVTRLRNWRSVHLARLHLLMEEAADEMERLSGTGDCPGSDNAAKQDILTTEEREAVEWCVEMAMNSATDCVAEINTLRGLLERMQ